MGFELPTAGIGSTRSGSCTTGKDKLETYLKYFHEARFWFFALRCAKNLEGIKTSAAENLQSYSTATDIRHGLGMIFDCFDRYNPLHGRHFIQIRTFPRFFPGMEIGHVRHLHVLRGSRHVDLRQPLLLLHRANALYRQRHSHGGAGNNTIKLFLP